MTTNVPSLLSLSFCSGSSVKSITLCKFLVPAAAAAKSGFVVVVVVEVVVAVEAPSGIRMAYPQGSPGTKIVNEASDAVIRERWNFMVANRERMYRQVVGCNSFLCVCSVATTAYYYYMTPLLGRL